MKKSEFDKWQEVFSLAWKNPSEVITLRCPHCSHVGLRMVYVVRSIGDTDAMFAFWCPDCLYGLPPNTGALPNGEQGVLTDEVSIPNYRIVRPE